MDFVADYETCIAMRNSLPGAGRRCQYRLPNADRTCAQWRTATASAASSAADAAPHRATRLRWLRCRLGSGAGQPLGDELRVRIDELLGGFVVAHPVHRGSAGAPVAPGGSRAPDPTQQRQSGRGHTLTRNSATLQMTGRRPCWPMGIRLGMIASSSGGGSTGCPRSTARLRPGHRILRRRGQALRRRGGHLPARPGTEGQMTPWRSAWWRSVPDDLSRRRPRTGWTRSASGSATPSARPSGAGGANT
jgi:hypothetical protein